MTVGSGVTVVHRPLPVQTAPKTGTQPAPHWPPEGGPQARKPKSHWQQSLGPSVGVTVGDTVAVNVGLCVAVGEGVEVGVRVKVRVGVEVEVEVGVGVGVEDGVGVGVRVTQRPVVESHAALNTGAHCSSTQLPEAAGPQARKPKSH